MQEFDIDNYYPYYIGFFIEKLLPDSIQERNEMKYEIIRLTNEIMDNKMIHSIWDKKGKKGKAILRHFDFFVYHAPLTKTRAEIESEKNIYKDKMDEILQEIDGLDLAYENKVKTQEQILLESSNIRKKVRILIHDYIENIVENNVKKE
jgi:predicted DNA-binding WGR domain protein